MEITSSGRCFLPFADPSNRFVMELAGVLQMKLRFYSGAIGVDRAHAEMEAIADLTCASSVSYELEYFQLSVGGLGDTVIILSSHPNSLKDPWRDSRRQINLPTEH